MTDTSTPSAPVVDDSETTEEGDTSIVVAPVILNAPPAEPETPPEEVAEEVAEAVVEEAAAEPAEVAAFDAGVAIGALAARVDALEAIVYAEPEEVEEEGEVEETEEGETEPGEVEPDRVEPSSKKVHWMFRSLKDWRG